MPGRVPRRIPRRYPNRNLDGYPRRYPGGYSDGYPDRYLDEYLGGYPDGYPDGYLGGYSNGCSAPQLLLSCYTDLSDVPGLALPPTTPTANTPLLLLYCSSTVSTTMLERELS